MTIIDEQIGSPSVAGVPEILQAYRAVPTDSELQDKFWRGLTEEEQHTLTLATYDSDPKQYAHHMVTIGSRVAEIALGLDLAGYEPLEISSDGLEASVVEYGCGAGRDAKDIVQRVGQYLGTDPSEGFIDIARQQNPGVEFAVADALSTALPEDLDVAFAFASFVHVPEKTLSQVFEKSADSLRRGGIILATLKEKSSYCLDHYKDDYPAADGGRLIGSRTFVNYDRATAVRMVENAGLRTALLKTRLINNIPWLYLAARKP